MDIRHVPLNGSAGRLGFRLCGSQVDDVINRFDVFGPHVVLKNLYAQGAHKKTRTQLPSILLHLPLKLKVAHLLQELLRSATSRMVSPGPSAARHDSFGSNSVMYINGYFRKLQAQRSFNRLWQENAGPVWRSNLGGLKKGKQPFSKVPSKPNMSSVGLTKRVGPKNGPKPV